MRKVDVNICNELGETTYVTKLSNGLTVYICKKEGYEKKIGLFGTKYGSLINDFVDIKTGKRLRVPDGIKIKNEDLSASLAVLLNSN